MRDTFEFLLTCLVEFVRAWFRAIALMSLWKWFVMTTFGMPELKLRIAMGLVITIQLLFHHSGVWTRRSKTKEGEKDDGLIYRAVMSILYAAMETGIFLMFGYFINRYV